MMVKSDKVEVVCDEWSYRTMEWLELRPRGALTWREKEAYSWWWIDREDTKRGLRPRKGCEGTRAECQNGREARMQCTIEEERRESS